MKGPLTESELARLQALARYDILDTLPEAGFDRLVAVAARSLRTPIALVTLVDEERQWFKACIGLDLRQTDRSLSFCAHAILGEGVMVVPDATADERFHDNALVTGPPHIRFYAGAPLVTPDGYALGTLCVIDDKPRAGLSDDERATLQDLAAMAMDELELRVKTMEAERGREANASLTRDLRAALARARVMHAVSALANLRLGGPQLVLRGAELLRPALGADWAGLVTLRGDRGLAVTLAASERGAALGGLLEGYLDPDGDRLLWERQGERSLVEAEGALAFGGRLSRTSAPAFTVAPLGAHDGRALLLVLARGPEAWGARERELLETVVGELRAQLERDAALHEARVQADRLRLALEAAPLVLFATDAGGALTLAEGRGLSPLGLRPGDVAGRPLREVFPGLTDGVRRALAGEHVDAVVEAGDRVYEAHVEPLSAPDGPVLGALGIAYDVTARFRAERAARDADRQARALLDLGRTLDAAVTLEQAAEGALGPLLAALAADWGAVWRREHGVFYPLALHGDVPPALAGLWRTRGMPVAWYADHGALTGAMFLGPTDLRPEARRYGMSGAAVAAVAPDDPEGTLLLGAYRRGDERPWSEAERDLLVAAARTLGVAVDRQGRARALEAAARTDLVTGLGNRRAFEHALGEEHARALRRDHGLGLLLVDLDGFGALIEREGHARGDGLLRVFADALRAALRVDDKLHRLGGGEFAAVLTHYDPGGEAVVLGRVRAAVAAARAAGFPDLAASVGLAAPGPDRPDADALWRAAEVALAEDRARRRRDAGA